MGEAWAKRVDSAPSKHDVLFKSASEIIQRLDVLSKNESVSKSLFEKNATGYRLRLRNILLKLIFMDPVKFGNKCEELMWQRVFYEPIRIAKSVAHSPEVGDQTQFFEGYRAHLVSALGFYQNLLVRFQQEFYRSDVWPDAWKMVGIQRISRSKESEVSVVSSQLAERVAYKTLIYIGDLYRYRVEVGDFYSRATACAYYQLAAAINPDNGAPHNQLGTLDVSRCFGLNTVFHCLRAVVSPAPFEGAKGNLATFLLNNEARFVCMRENKFPMPSLHSQVMNRKAAIKLKDLRITIIKYLFLVHRNAQAFLKSDMGILKAPDDVQLLDEVVDDIGFMLHSETKRFGAKCINRMLPKFVGNFNHVPDFCPDPESLGRQKTASTPLLPPIVLRMILIVLLFTELLSENEDKVQEITVPQLFERSKEFPLFILYSLDLLLIHSFRAMAKTVNIFKLAAFKRLGVVQLSVPSTSRKCLHQENKNLKVEDGSERGDTSFNEDTYERGSDMEEHFEELEVRSQKDQDSDEEETEESDSSGMSSRGPRLRRLRPRCRMMEEDDFLNSSFSEEDEDEDSEYSEESDDYDEQDWSFPDEDNMDSNVNELKSQNSESSLSCDEVAQSQKDSTRIKIVLAASMPAQAGQTLFVNDETRLHEASLMERRSESESEKVDSSIEGHEKSGSADNEKAILNDNDPAGSDYIWLRLFVAAYFVDSLLSGIKLITDWLLFSPTFLQHAASTYNFIMQEIASHLASLLNYLSPIVHIVEQELSSDLSMNSEYLGLPVSGIRTPSTLLPHISNNCRELLKREFQQNEIFKRVALPEDWLLRGIPSLSSLHKTLDFGTNSLSSRIEETLLRCLALIRFGRKFAKLADGLGLNFVYHHDVNYFTAPLPSNAATSTSYCRSRCHGGPPRRYAPRRGRRRRKREPYKPRIQSFQALSQRTEDERLCPTSEPHSVTSVDMPTSTSLATREETMRNMAKMRLKNQVDRLSEEMDKRIYATVPSAPLVGQRDSHLPYSPYIVVDTFSLIGNTTFMKRLFASHQYVIIIPRKVIAHLDQLKKTTATARSATRVLEEQTGGGSGYVRIQTEDENPRERIKIRLPKARSNGNEAVDSCADVPVDFSVVSRWAGIIECAIYFSQVSQETSHFRGAEINLAKSVKVVNLLEYQLSATEEVSRAKITVLVGSKLAAPQDLEIPLDLAKLAWESGIIFEAFHQFAQRWKSKGR